MTTNNEQINYNAMQNATKKKIIFSHFARRYFYFFSSTSPTFRRIRISISFKLTIFPNNHFLHNNYVIINYVTENFLLQNLYFFYERERERE